jgi:glutamate formiminotransferase
MTNNLPTVDQMICFCDAALPQRNDLAAAPTGQYEIRTDRIDPVWPNDFTTSVIAQTASKAMMQA